MGKQVVKILNNNKLNIETEHKGVNILSLEAKDIVMANLYYDANIGFNPRFTSGNKIGELNYRKFINVLDYSLESMKLEEIYKKKYRRNTFKHTVGNHDYSLAVINVKFTYALKLFNKIASDTYVRVGYKFSELEFTDNVCIIDGELVGIITNRPTTNAMSDRLLQNNFKFIDGVYKERNIEILKTVRELREELYHNGFKCDGVDYCRYKRSSGASRLGKCLFVIESLYPAIHKWEMCGIKLEENDEVDLAALEAYISLTMSSIIDTIKIKPENILVIDDYESVFKDDVISVEDDNGVLVTIEKETEIVNNIWDGQSLMDKSLFVGKYKDKGMLLLRNRFFKSCCFNSNIQQFFKDNSIESVKQLNGFTLAENIEDIKLITTPNSIKYLKFGKIKTWLEKIEEDFGIVKYEKPTHYFDGRFVSTNYQLLNTLQLSQEECDALLKDSCDYYNLIRTDPAVLKYHIKYSGFKNVEWENVVKTNSDIVYKLLDINDKFYETKIFHNFKLDLLRSMKRRFQKGKILVKGNYSTICGNPLEMLYSSIGMFSGESMMGVGNIYNTKFDFNKNLLCCRSPHISSGNILLVKNTYNELIKDYMNPSNEIVYINSINENILQRLNGCDFDSDTMLITDNEILLESAFKNYDKFKVPTCNVSAKKIKRYYNSTDKVDLDFKTSNNKIGEIVNLAQEIIEIMWDKINTEDYNNPYFLKQCELDIAKLAVLSGIEIDSAKKEFDISVDNELKYLKEKYFGKDSSNRGKPLFFKEILRSKGYSVKGKIFSDNKSTMDYVQHSISKQIKLTRRSHEYISLYDIFDFSGARTDRVDYKRVDEVVNAVKVLIATRLREMQNFALDGNESHLDFFDQILKGILFDKKMSIHTTIHILKLLEEKEYSKIKKTLFDYVFSSEDSRFFDLIKKSHVQSEKLEECEDGDIEIYGIKFRKITTFW